MQLRYVELFANAQSDENIFVAVERRERLAQPRECRLGVNMVLREVDEVYEGFHSGDNSRIDAAHQERKKNLLDFFRLGAGPLSEC